MTKHVEGSQEIEISDRDQPSVFFCHLCNYPISDTDEWVYIPKLRQKFHIVCMFEFKNRSSEKNCD